MKAASKSDSETAPKPISVAELKKYRRELQAKKKKQILKTTGKAAPKKATPGVPCSKAGVFLLSKKVRK